MFILSITSYKKQGKSCLPSCRAMQVMMIKARILHMKEAIIILTVWSCDVRKQQRSVGTLQEVQTALKALVLLEAGEQQQVLCVHVAARTSTYTASCERYHDGPSHLRLTHLPMQSGAVTQQATCPLRIPTLTLTHTTVSASKWPRSTETTCVQGVMWLYPMLGFSVFEVDFSHQYLFWALIRCLSNFKSV